MRHYDSVELEQYHRKEMAAALRLLCSAHLRKCPECRDKLRKIKNDQAFLDKLRRFLR